VSVSSSLGRLNMSWRLVAACCLLGTAHPWQQVPRHGLYNIRATSVKRQYILSEAGFVQLTAADLTTMVPFVLVSIGLQNWGKKPKPAVAGGISIPPVEPIAPPPTEFKAVAVETQPETPPPAAPPVAATTPVVAPPPKTTPSPVAAVATKFTPDMKKTPEPAPETPVAVVAAPEDEPPAAVDDRPKRPKLIKLAASVVAVGLLAAGLLGTITRPAVAVLLL